MQPNLLNIPVKYVIITCCTTFVSMYVFLAKYLGMVLFIKI